MNMDQEKFHVHSWWAKTPDFALAALARQLDAAKTIWPEYLGAYDLVKRVPPPDPSAPPVESKSEVVG